MDLSTPSEVSTFEADFGKNVRIFRRKCQENVRIVSIFKTKFYVDTLVYMIWAPMVPLLLYSLRFYFIRYRLLLEENKY